MPAFKLKLEVTDPNIVIERRLRTAIADKINLAANIASKKAASRFRQLIYEAIINSPEVKSLMGGELQGELGADSTLVNVAVNDIIDKLIQSIQIDVKPFSPFGGAMRGHIEISLFPKSLIDDLTQLSSGSYLTKRGEKIPWLEWLLTLGDKIIVRNYSVDFLKTKGSRTGLATMKQTKRRGWRVPPQFSGTRTDNFITRSLDDIADLFMYHLKLEFTRAL